MAARQLLEIQTAEFFSTYVGFFEPTGRETGHSEELRKVRWKQGLVCRWGFSNWSCFVRDFSFETRVCPLHGILWNSVFCAVGYTQRRRIYLRWFQITPEDSSPSDNQILLSTSDLRWGWKAKKVIRWDRKTSLLMWHDSHKLQKSLQTGVPFVLLQRPRKSAKNSTRSAPTRETRTSHTSLFCQVAAITVKQKHHSVQFKFHRQLQPTILQIRISLSAEVQNWWP